MKDSKLKIFSAIKNRIMIAEIIAYIVVLLIFAFSPLSKNIDNRISLYTYNEYIRFAIYITIVGVVFSIVEYFFSYYSSYIIEHDFELSNQSLKEWENEHLKSLLVNAVIMLPLAILFFSIIKQFGTYWWIFFGTTLFIISVLLAKIAPVLIFPLFHKYTSLENEEIRNRLFSLLENHNLKTSEIFSFNLSKNTKKANAGFTGIGSTKRIILSDTLIEKFTPEEIEVIFAHELGHYFKKHIVKNIIFNGIFIFSTFFLCNSIYSFTLEKMNFFEYHSIPAIPILILYLSLAFLILMPFSNFISRKHEKEADLFAINRTGNIQSFISSMEKISEINLADKEPNKIIEFLFHGHPSIKSRIDFAKKQQL